VDFYTRLLGLEIAVRLEFGAERLVFLRAGNAWIELIEDGGRARTTGVVDHVALRVTDLDGWLQRLREVGVTLVDPRPIEVPQLGARIAFCLGPDGERIELIERT
jgi:lactoylglutathione lyase